MPANNALSMLVVSCALALMLTGATVAAQTADNPTVTVEDTTVAPGETTTVAVTLSGAPDGLAGYNLTLSLDDSTATLTNASTADQFALANTTVSADTVTLSAVDTDDAVGPGATDVDLCEVTLRGETAGTTELTVRSTQMDDDSGTAIAPATAGGTVTVEATDGDGNGTDDPENRSGANQSESNETDDSSDGSGPGFGAVAAMLALIGAVLFSLRHRNAA
jgi:PGF-CTERM protein